MKKIGKGRISIERGEVFQLQKLAITVVVVSNKLHNLLSKYINVVLATDKKVDEVRESLEVVCFLKDRKLKILTSYLSIINKKTLQETGVYLGKIDDQTREDLEDKIRSVLDL